MGLLGFILPILKFSFLFLFVLSPDDWEILRCSDVVETIKDDRMCWAHINDLRPSQISAGYWCAEMNMKKAETAYESGHLKFNFWRKQKILPVNISPGGYLYLFNEHHTCKGVYDSTVIPEDEKWLYVKVVKNLQHLPTMSLFYQYLIKHSYIWLSDEKSHHPIDPQLLPKSISGLINDPFRSLAYVTKNYRAWHTDDDDVNKLIPFVEFYWANYYRTELADSYNQYAQKKNPTHWNDTVCTYQPYSAHCFDNEEQFISKLMNEALKVSVSEKASGLPGYIGKLDLDFIFELNGREWDIYAS